MRYSVTSKNIILTFAQSVQIHWQFHIRWTGYCLISFAKHGKFVPGRKLLNYFWNISNSIFVQGESRIALLCFWSLWNSIFVRGEPSLQWLHFFFLILDGCQRSLDARMPNQIIWDPYARTRMPGPICWDSYAGTHMLEPIGWDPYAGTHLLGPKCQDPALLN